MKSSEIVLDTSNNGTFGASRALDAGELAQAIAQGPGQKGQAWDNILANNPGLANTTKKEAAVAASSGKQTTTSKAAAPSGSSGSGGGSYATRSGWVKSSSGAMVH